MKQSIKYGILFLGLIVIIDLISGVVFKNQFHQIKFGDYGVINKSINSDAEILILGSSRAVHHYNPSLISSTLKKSSYNAGFGGQGMFLNYALLNEISKKNLPEIVILDLSPNIIVDKQSYSKLNIFLPYYKKYKSFKEIIQLNSDFTKLELVSNLYIYNSTLYDFFRNIFFKEKEKYSGFKPLKGEINKTNFKPFFLKKETMTNNKIMYLNKIIDFCKKYNIKLIGIVSPTYIKFDKNNRIINKLNTIFKNNDLEFYDYSNYANLYQNNIFFKDQLHLNEKGAAIFSDEIANLIKL